MDNFNFKSLFNFWVISYKYRFISGHVAAGTARNREMALQNRLARITFHYRADCSFLKLSFSITGKEKLC